MRTEPHPESRPAIRKVITFGMAALFAAAVTFIRVPTTLGVQVPRPETLFTEPDLSSSEYIWRVWWRARDDLVDVDPQWLVTAGLLAILAVFAAGMVTAIWLVTGPLTGEDLAPSDD